ncbi:MAG: AAA family ATPase, partial [Fimbriiglobus sp.]
MSLAATNDLEMVEKLREAHARLKREIGKVIIGQDQVIDQLLMAIFCRSHALLVGVPGLAKTLMVSTLSQALDLSFKRIQFTPDLMPSDITGSEVIQDDPATRQRMFKFLPGPIFANIVLADEINRTPPKTQAALLEAMQERKCSIGGTDHPMRNPFFVLATQNPIEQEGTYPLPEAQLDRFLFLINVGYPTDAEEELIMRAGTSDAGQKVSAVLNAEDIIALQQVVRRVPVSDKVFGFAKRITRLSRPGTPDAADFATKWLTWGAGPRASMNLILAAKAHALLRGSNHVAGDDVVAVALPVLRHR